MKKAWDNFTAAHPRFPGFLSAVKSRGILEGDVVEISITGTDGKTIATNIRVTAGDLELFETLKGMSPN